LNIQNILQIIIWIGYFKPTTSIEAKLQIKEGSTIDRYDATLCSHLNEKIR